MLATHRTTLGALTEATSLVLAYPNLHPNPHPCYLTPLQDHPRHRGRRRAYDLPHPGPPAWSKRHLGSATTRYPLPPEAGTNGSGWVALHTLEERPCRSEVLSAQWEARPRAHQPRPTSPSDSEALAIQSYILAVNPAIIADSGGTCHPCSFYKASDGNPPSSCFPDQYEPFFLPAIFTDAYVECTQELRRDLVVVTAGTSALATFLVGVGANLPFALAPGMGLNAYFTYTVVGFRGSGPVAFETALGAVFIEGIIFMAIAALGLRGYIVQAIPKPQPWP